MSFQERQARFKRLHREHASWQLLRADNAPHVLAFIASLFDSESEVPFGRARAALEAELSLAREDGSWETEVNATTYLRQWIQAGWLRELDDRLSVTEAADNALQLAMSLERRDLRATASHLRIVQDTAAELAMLLNPNPKERLKVLRAKRKQLDSEIKALQAGVVEELPEREQRERLLELYQLASVLSGDFRRVEEEIRQLDKALRVQMVESTEGRGEVIEALLSKEELLADSDAGRAFDGFFRLLSDPERSKELRAQLRSVLERPAAKHLNSGQFRYLSQLMRELSRESERVFQVRRRTEQSLRGYVERGGWQEGRAIEQLLGQLERGAVQLNQAEVKLHSPLGLKLPSGNAKLQAPTSWRLHQPTEHIDAADLSDASAERELSSESLAAMHSVRVLAVARQIHQHLQQHGPATLGTLIKATPVEQGLEELVAYVRIAQSLKATRLPDEEHVEFISADGQRRRARIPSYMLQASQFPATLEDLDL